MCGSEKMRKSLKSREMQEIRKVLNATDGCGGWVKMQDMQDKTKLGKSEDCERSRASF